MMRLLLTVLFGLSAGYAQAQLAAPRSDPAQQLYEDVVSGRRSAQSLTDDEKRLFLAVHEAQSKPQSHAFAESYWQTCESPRLQ